MRVSNAVAAASLLAGADAWRAASTSGTDKLAAQGLLNLAHYEAQHNPPPSCNTTTGYFRKEWLTLTATEKKAYISAVRCLQKKPSISGALAPGARSRYDDFVGTHINQTLTIHGTGNFLSWHRYFVWAYEKALREECGYKGYQPYINWGKYAKDLVNSPLFDGSATSISGNGAYLPHPGAGIPSNDAPNFVIPPGNGSGCVTSGPFKDFRVNLGPVSPALNNITANPQADGLGYNPRCLRRDLSQAAATKGSTEAISLALLTNWTNVGDFQNYMQGNSFLNNYLGVHTAGHFWVGGDPGGDLYASPGDPFFWLHHAQIDRTWWIWQNQDLRHRQNAIAGTNTIFNFPPSANTTLQDTIDLGVNAPAIKIGDAMSTLGGQFCYIYL